MIIKKEEYVKVVQRPYPPLWSSLILAGATNEIYYKPFLRKPYALRKTIVLDSAWYYWKNADDEGCRVTSEEWKNKKRLNRGIKLLAQEERNLVNSIKKDFKTLCLKFETYMPAVGLTYFAEFFYEQTKKLLKKKISPVKAEELLGWLNIPLRDNFYKKEEYDLVTSKSIKNHVKKYEWILSRYGDDVPYTEKDARQKLLGINRRIFLKKRSDEKRNIKIAIARVKKILGKTNAYLIDGLQFIVFYRTQRTDIINKVAYLYIPYLKKIASKYALSYDELLMCTKDEVINGEIPSKTLLAERANGHAMIVDRNKVLCLVGKEYKALKQIFKEKVKDVEIIGGNVASRGVANGVVKVILSRNDFSKMNKGDILVANMTTPEMIPIMKKAAAFVTDEGGITCHAAIVSREMNRPCIIGTKIATKVLKDGDLVEVDANKGVVKIIKNKN